MDIMPNRMDRGYYMYQREFEEKALEVLRSGWYVLGKEVASFEEEFAAYVGAKYCVGLASGLDALWLAFRILGIGAGDEVIERLEWLMRAIVYKRELHITMRDLRSFIAFMLTRDFSCDQVKKLVEYTRTEDIAEYYWLHY